MWKGPNEDPEGPDGGGPSQGRPPPTQGIEDLKDQLDQQQTLIAQLKEMLRKTDQTTVTQEKVAEYANTLTKMNARAKRGKLKERTDEGQGTTPTKKIETPASEKILLLRQQLEQNKVKIAERGKNQKGLEDMVTQIKAQLDDSQHLMSQTPLNISLIDDRVDYTPTTNSHELYNILLNKDKRISELNGKIGKLEANVLDLQENVKEKDSVIDARTKAITLMSENLSKKGKNTLDALDETKEQMRKMQQNFVLMEEEMKREKSELTTELDNKKSIIIELESTNEKLTRDYQELNQKTDNLAKENETLLQQLNQPASKDVETSDISKQQRLTDEIETLNKRIAELEETNTKLRSDSPRNSPSRGSKKGKKGKHPQKQQDDQQTSEMIKKIAALEKSLEEVSISKDEADNTEIALDNLRKEHAIKLAELDETIANLNSTIQSLEQELKKNDDPEISLENKEAVKLKQQLDESNKNMIKVKALHKSKLKELNKKIDAFKKIGDANVEVVRLDAENSKLSQKIAELEEEKGQLQLNMVESKESINLEEIKDLESKLSRHLEEISAKNERLDELEKEHAAYEEKIIHLTEKLENLSTLHNAQVKSDLTSVQYEEELEKIVAEKGDLIKETENIKSELRDALERIENLEKEKQEIQSKLDAFMQENIELLDRLEKLSAEKVSSAESIEIVENLTHQEKLELEAYQKSLAHKSSENLAESPELNDSVNQLTEETSELLQKIELFTVERREVMEKMEALTLENGQLNLKIKEIENNRDILVETYEQLQTEKEELDDKMERLEKESDDVSEYKSLIEIQKQEIQELQLKLLSQTGFEESNIELKGEIEKLQDRLKAYEQSPEITKRIENFEKKIEENLVEIANYKSIVEETKDEMISSSNIIADLHEKLRVKSTEVEHYYAEVENLKSITEELNSHLQDENQKLESNSETINNQQEEINMLRDRIRDAEDLMDKNNEVIAALKLENNSLQTRLTEENDGVRKVCDDLKTRCLTLQSQIDQNSGSIGPFEIKVHELEKKNKEQIEKMKILAANLMKKTADYKKLEAENLELTEKFEDEMEEKEKHIANFIECNEAGHLKDVRIEGLLYEIKVLQDDLKNRIAECKGFGDELAHQREERAVLRQKNTELSNQNLNNSALIEDLENIKTEYENQISGLSSDNELLRSNANNTLNIEASEKDELIADLNEQLEARRANANALQMKIHELEMYIESQDGELTKEKERVGRLEEGLSKVEERRLSLERKAIELGTELQEKETSFEEMSQNGDYLEQRLKVLAEHDAAIEKRLQETIEENSDYQKKYQKLIDDNNSLQKQITSLNEKLKESGDGANEKLFELENENGALQSTISRLGNDLKQASHDLNCYKLEAENELQEQVEHYCVERKLLKEQIELLKEAELSLLEKQNEYTQEISVLNLKLDQQQSDFEDNLMKYQRLENEHKKCLATIEGMGASDEISDQLKDEIEELVALSQSKQTELKAFEDREISPADFFDTAQLKPELENEISSLNQLIVEKNRCLSERIHGVGGDLKSELEIVKKEREDLKTKLEEYASELSETKDQLEFVKNMNQQTEQYNMSVLLRSDKLEEQISSLQNELAVKVQPVFPSTDDRDDPFAFVTEKPLQAAPESTSNSQEELLQKIKALEFMLYNVEQEKDKAMVECSKLTNELTTLVFERENKRLTEIESQIMEGNEVVLSPTNQVLEAIPSTSQEPIPSTSQEPVVEELCVATTAYQCFPDINKAGDTFEENDDGWGWGPEEAKLEQEHLEKVAQQPVEKTPEEKLEDRIRVLELERENHLEEINQAQIRCGKFIKKLKQFKSLNEKLSAKVKSDDCGDLNDAIVDELKLQVANLEKRAKDINLELEKEKHEKDNLLKKIDVLTAANERMVEMKEKQDIDIISWQQINRELTSKLEQFEWGDDEPSPKKSVRPDHSYPSEHGKQVDELNSVIKELTLDNEELQTMLEEQRNMRLEAEREKSVQPILENMKSEAEYSAVLSENKLLNQKISDLEEKIKEVSHQLQQNYVVKTQLEATVMDNNITIESLNQQLNELSASFEFLKHNEGSNQNATELKQKLDELESEKRSLAASKESEMKQLQDQIDNLTIDKTELQGRLHFLEENDISIAKMTEELESLESEKSVLFQQIDQSKNILNHLEEQLNLFTAKVETLEGEKAALLQQIDQLNHKTKQLEEELKQRNIKSDTENIEKLQALENEKIALIQQVDQSNIRVQQLEEKISGDQAKLDELQAQFQSKELEFQQKLSATVEQLSLEWSQHVEQRGNDVATSWTLHLESRESEFAELHNQLKKEIDELEEKCNVLVNENNELRKNVDTEIRNEVDRISALQQKISDRQLQIDELNKILQDKITENNTIILENSNYKESINELNRAIQEQSMVLKENSCYKENIDELNRLLRESSNENSNHKETINELNRILKEKSAENAELSQSLQITTSDNQEVINSLKSSLEDASRNLQDSSVINELKQLLDEKTVEIYNHLQTINCLQSSLDDATKKYQELISLTNEKESLIADLQIRLDAMTAGDETITHLQLLLEQKEFEVATQKQQMEELEKHQTAFAENAKTITSSLQLDSREKDNDITEHKLLLDDYKNQLEQYKVHLNNLEGTLKEKDYKIEDLTNKLQIESSNIPQLQQRIYEYEQQISNYNMQLQENYLHVQSLTEEVQNTRVLTEHVQMKEFEITRLNSLLAEKEREFEYNLQNQLSESQSVLTEQTNEIDTLKRRLEQSEINRDEIVTSKDAELESYRQLLETTKAGELELTQQLQAEISTKDSKCTELETLVQDDEKQLEELKSIIEEQVLKIEELKKELYERSSSYDALIAEKEIPQELSTPKAKRRVHFETSTDEDQDLAEPVNRAELDVALYMLHQRDVRCEELTVELMQLLEERDTLQLRLSNALREKEQLKSLGDESVEKNDESNEKEVKLSVSASMGAIPKSKAIILGATGTELAAEATEFTKEDASLANKLSELKILGYKKDKTLVDEQEVRRYQQFSILQQHKDEMAKLPAEAAARLVDASYTLSRDVQSPSKVLLDWLWGRSTPKVNNV